MPLVATYEDQHVLTATTYSKSALRSAAEDIRRKYAHVDYLPSYEVITGNFNRGSYFEDDLRSVKTSGVDHVMRLFFKHYTQSSDRPAEDIELDPLFDVVCEEEQLDVGN